MATSNYRIRVIHDNNPENPFKDWECQYPLMYRGGWGDEDFSDGDIDDYLIYYLTDGQIIYHQKKLYELMGDDSAAHAESKKDKIGIIGVCLYNFIKENLPNKVAFCKAFGIPHYFAESRGHSKGDYANVLIVPTKRHSKLCGYDIDKVTEDQLHSTFKLFSDWAWGDVFGYIVEEGVPFRKVYEDGTEEEGAEWEEVASCWGFYGRDAEESGMVDSVDYVWYGWTREQAIEIINNAEVEF